MALYAYKCDNAKEEIILSAPMGFAPAEAYCDVHQSPAYRVFITQAAILHPLRSAYFIPANPKTQAEFVKQEENRGHDVRGRYKNDGKSS